MYNTVIKHGRHLRTWAKCRKHELQASVCNNLIIEPPFNKKIYSDICPWTLSVLRSEQFSLCHAFGKMRPSNIPAYFKLCLLSFKYFLNVENITPIFPSFSWDIFSLQSCHALDQPHTSREHILFES